MSEDEKDLVRGWFTLAEAAAQLGITSAALRGAAARKRIHVQQINPRLNIITVAEVERYRREYLGHKGWDKRRGRSPDIGPEASEPNDLPTHKAEGED